MGKFDGVLLATDFDDTLFRSNITGPGVSEAQRRSEVVVSGRNKEALDHFLSQGGRFTVATGRAFQTFSPYIGRVPINAPVILANGAILFDFDRNREIFHAYLPGTIAAHAEALSQLYPELGFETHLGDLIYTYRPNEVSRRHIHKLGFPFRECPFARMPQPWTKLLVQHEDHEVLTRAQRWFSEAHPGLYEAIFSNDRLLEITAAGINKGRAVQRLAQLLEIRPENLYCVGDNQNDLPMLEVSALPFAPANCAPTVRTWGATIVSPCDEGAIADVIEILDERY